MNTSSIVVMQEEQRNTQNKPLEPTKAERVIATVSPPHSSVDWPVAHRPPPFSPIPSSRMFTQIREDLDKHRTLCFDRARSRAIMESYDVFQQENRNVSYKQGYKGVPVTFALPRGYLIVCGLTEIQDPCLKTHHWNLDKPPGLVISCLSHCQKEAGAIVKSFADQHGATFLWFAIGDDKERFHKLDFTMDMIFGVLKQNGTVIVQCVAGRHRAVYMATIIIMLCLGLDLKEVRAWIQLIRPQAALDDFLAGRAERHAGMSDLSRQACLDFWNSRAKDEKLNRWCLLGPLEATPPGWAFTAPVIDVNPQCCSYRPV